ncbi:MAG: acyltransferase, partial [Alphaproteobacteria bacterium]|nr:acyltransferase [Alphaproteobacteria bacterium]
VLIAEAVFVFDELALSSSPYRVLLVSAAASLMICGVINGAAQNLLLAPPLRFLGRISYSLYLLHLIPVYLISIALVDFGLPYDKLSSQLLDLALTIPSSIALAAFGYWAIERPSIRAGRHVAARLPEAWRQRRFTPPESRRAAPEMPEEDAKARTLRTSSSISA